MCVHALRGEQFEQRWIDKKSPSSKDLQAETFFFFFNWAFAQNWIHLLAMGYFVFSSACELVMLEFNFFLFAPVFVLTLNIQNLYFCSVLPLSPAGSLVWCYHALLSWNVHLELCSLWKCNLLAASSIFASSWFCALKDWPISFKAEGCTALKSLVCVQSSPCGLTMVRATSQGRGEKNLKFSGCGGSSAGAWKELKWWWKMGETGNGVWEATLTWYGCSWRLGSLRFFFKDCIWQRRD